MDSRFHNSAPSCTALSPNKHPPVNLTFCLFSYLPPIYTPGDLSNPSSRSLTDTFRCTSLLNHPVLGLSPKHSSTQHHQPSTASHHPFAGQLLYHNYTPLSPTRAAIFTLHDPITSVRPFSYPTIQTPISVRKQRIKKPSPRFDRFPFAIIVASEVKAIK